MARNPDGEDAVPTEGPALSRERRPPPTRTDIYMAAAAKAARLALREERDDEDDERRRSEDIGLARLVVKGGFALALVVVVVLGGVVGVYLGLGYGGATVTSGPGGKSTVQVGP